MTAVAGDRITFGSKKIGIRVTNLGTTCINKSICIGRNGNIRKQGQLKTPLIRIIIQFAALKKETTMRRFSLLVVTLGCCSLGVRRGSQAGWRQVHRRRTKDCQGRKDPRLQRRQGLLLLRQLPEGI